MYSPHTLFADSGTMPELLPVLSLAIALHILLHKCESRVFHVVSWCLREHALCGRMCIQDVQIYAAACLIMLLGLVLVLRPHLQHPVTYVAFRPTHQDLAAWSKWTFD